MSRWRSIELGEVAEFKNGLNYSPTDVGEGVKIIGVPAFQNGLRPKYDGLESIKWATVAGSDLLLKHGDLLFVRSNGNKALIGRCMIIDTPPELVSHSGFTIRARLMDATVDPLFIAYFFQTSSAREQLHRQGGGTNISNLSQAILSRITLPWPPDKLRQAITSLAVTFDQAIDTVGALYARKCALKRELMHRVLTGDVRFKTMTADWKERRLGDLFDERREVGRSDLGLLSVTGSDGVVVRDALGRRDTSAEDKSRYLRVAVGDIVYNTMRMWQGVAGLSHHEGIVSPAYTVCMPKSDVDGRFAAHLFKLPETIHRFYEHSQGLVSDTWNLKFHHFASVRVKIPLPTEQTKIADFLDTVDEELRILRRERELRERQKQAVLQLVFAGEVRSLGLESA